MAAKLSAAERKKAMETFLREYGRIGLIRPAASVAGVNVTTVHRWRRKYKGFANDFEACRDEIRAHFDDAIMQAAQQGDWRAAAHGIDLMERQVKTGKAAQSGSQVREKAVRVTVEVEEILRDVMGGAADTGDNADA